MAFADLHSRTQFTVSSIFTVLLHGALSRVDLAASIRCLSECLSDRTKYDESSSYAIGGPAVNHSCFETFGPLFYLLKADGIFVITGCAIAICSRSEIMFHCPEDLRCMEPQRANGLLQYTHIHLYDVGVTESYILASLTLGVWRGSRMGQFSRDLS